MPCAQEIASQLLIAPLLTSPHRGFKGGAYDPTFQEACNVSFTGWSFILRITHCNSSRTAIRKAKLWRSLAVPIQQIPGRAKVCETGA
jgi:hypothetical protein